MNGNGYLLDTNAIVLTADDHFKKPKAPWRARFFAVDAGI